MGEALRERKLLEPTPADTDISESGQMMITTTSAAHRFTAGQQVSIANAKEPDYDGLYTIVSVPNPTTFT